MNTAKHIQLTAQQWMKMYPGATLEEAQELVKNPPLRLTKAKAEKEPPHHYRDPKED